MGGFGGMPGGMGGMPGGGAGMFGMPGGFGGPSKSKQTAPVEKVFEYDNL